MDCEDCGKNDDTVEQTFCPYAAEINEMALVIVVCGDCLYERAMDI